MPGSSNPAPRYCQLLLARQAEDTAALGLALHRRHEAAEIMATAVVYGAS